MKLRGIFVAVLICAALASACTMREVKKNYDSTRNWVFETEPTAKPSHVEDNTPLIELNYDAADALDSDLWLKFDPKSPIYFKQFTNMTDPGDTAPLGRVVTEQVIARLAQSELNVVTGKPRPEDYEKPAPVMVMKSEDGEEMAVEEKPSAEEQMRPYTPSILTGTYLIGDDVIFISAKITSLRENRVVSGYQWTLPINQNTRTLLPQLMRPQRGMTPTVQTRF